MSILATGSVAIISSAIGGSFVFLGQRSTDKRAQRRSETEEHRRYLAALRLLLMDLDRSVDRLERMQSKDDPRGFTELPRGAWTEYRGLLSPHLSPQALSCLVVAYNHVIEWNEILWAAFTDRAPPTFHGADQWELDTTQAANLLNARYQQILKSIREATALVRSEQDGEAAGKPT